MRDVSEIIIRDLRNKKRGMLDRALRGADLDEKQQRLIDHMVNNDDTATVCTLCSILEAVRGAEKK